MREELKVNEIAKALAEPGFTEAQAAAWFRKLAGDVFPPEQQVGPQKHGLYHPLTPAAAAVVRAIWNVDAQDRGLLKVIYDGLVEESSNCPGQSWIAHILACAQTYPIESGLPALVATRVYDADEGRMFWRVDVLDSVSPDIELPEGQYPYVAIRVHCGLVLRRFARTSEDDDGST
jgi:hypothetical protein